MRFDILITEIKEFINKHPNIVGTALNELILTELGKLSNINDINECCNRLAEQRWKANDGRMFVVLPITQEFFNSAYDIFFDKMMDEWAKEFGDLYS